MLLSKIVALLPPPPQIFVTPFSSTIGVTPPTPPIDFRASNSSLCLQMPRPPSQRRRRKHPSLTMFTSQHPPLPAAVSASLFLRLHWNARRENCYNEDVLEDLQPHLDIKDLAIENYKGPAFPSWMQNTSQPVILHHLVKMELEDCSYCEQFPPLGHLPSLKVFKIAGMVNVKSIGAEFYGLTDVDGQSSSNGSPLTAPVVFPKLRELTLRELTSLEEWSEPTNLLNHSSTVCPLLEKFEVEQCPKLKRLLNVITSSHEHLRWLEVALCDSLDCLPEGVGGLQSLEDLEIHGLPSLSKLYIGHCQLSQPHKFDNRFCIECHAKMRHRCRRHGSCWHGSWWH